MTRIYDAQSLVDLPRLDANSASAVATSLASAAATEKKLAPNVAAGLLLVTTADTALKAVLVSGISAPPESELGKAMRAEAAVWAGIERWLKGIVQAGGATGAPVAEKLLAALYPEGLAFVRGAAAKRWSETDARVHLIAKDQLESQFTTLGGKDLLTNLLATHKATGVAAGITAAKTHVETPPVREKLDALKAAFRAYVLQVAANAALDPAVAAQALSAKLLAPLATYVAPEAAAKQPPVAAGPVSTEVATESAGA